MEHSKLWDDKMIIIEKNGRFAAFGARLDGNIITCPVFAVVDDLNPGDYEAQCWVDALDTPIAFRAIIGEYLDADTVYEGTEIQMEEI